MVKGSGFWHLRKCVDRNSHDLPRYLIFRDIGRTSLRTSMSKLSALLAKTLKVHRIIHMFVLCMQVVSLERTACPAAKFPSFIKVSFHALRFPTFVSLPSTLSIFHNTGHPLITLSNTTSTPRPRLAPRSIVPCQIRLNLINIPLST